MRSLRNRLGFCAIFIAMMALFAADATISGSKWLTIINSTIGPPDTVARTGGNGRTTTMYHYHRISLVVYVDESDKIVWAKVGSTMLISPPEETNEELVSVP